MRQVGAWVAKAGQGFARACLVLVVTLLVPAVWAAAVGVAIWWGGNPFSWTAPFVFACIGTFVLARPVSRMARSLVARWTGIVIPGGYLEPAPIVRMSTGYWWNGHSYSRSLKEAQEEQDRRIRWRDPAAWRDLRFVAIAAVTAAPASVVPPAGLVVAVLGFGVGSFALGALSLVMAVVSAPYAWLVLEPVAVRFLGGSAAKLLADRVDELTAQRADTTIAQAAEIRRIERDLHDGAQARLVALGLALATAEKLMETDPARAKELMREARAGAASSLTELRELVQGINPPVLNERGLVDAIRAFALDSPLEAEVSATGELRLDPPIESALYFGTAELVTNAAKHAQATRAQISVVRKDTDIVVEVEDDGRGGAGVRAGGGLDGLRRRLAVFDGTLEVDSPVGGPTRVRMVVPCESL